MLKKDIIIISAHCPNLKKERKLQDLVENLQGLRNKFDILVISHTPISKEICDKAVAENLIYGCGKPFKIILKDDKFIIEVCDYI